MKKQISMLGLKMRLKDHPERDEIIARARELWASYCGKKISMPGGTGIELRIKHVVDQVNREFNYSLSYKHCHAIISNKAYADKEYQPPKKENKHADFILI